MTITRRAIVTLPAALPAALALAARPARAATIAPFTEAAFAAAQAKGRPILIHIFATWCPVCAAQTPVIERLAAEPAFKGMTILRVNFDTQKPVVHAFGARMQSTLIAFHGRDRVGTLVGQTDPAAIRALFVSAESGHA